MRASVSSSLEQHLRPNILCDSTDSDGRAPDCTWHAHLADAEALVAWNWEAISERSYRLLRSPGMMSGSEVYNCLNKLPQLQRVVTLEML
jgi:hypothetical protein